MKFVEIMHGVFKKDTNFKNSLGVRMSARDHRKARKITQDWIYSNCFYCGQPMIPGKALEAHHNTKTIDFVKPRSMGGQPTAGNLVLCCKECNEVRGRISTKNSTEKKINTLYLYWKKTFKNGLRLKPEFIKSILLYIDEDTT